MTILGIDFGTTNTCISYYQNNQVHIIPNLYGSLTTPSCLYFDIHSSEILYGNIAYNLLQSKNNNRYLSNIIHNFKRLLGITYQHYINSQQLQLFFKNKHLNVIKDPFSDFCCIQFVHNNKETIFNIIEFTSIFLKFISLEAKSYLHLDTINIDIVITVPAYFSNIQRQHLQKACELSHLSILRIINEPTSASLAYAFYNTPQNNEYVLIVDCGGGTTDFSLLYMDYEEMLFEVENINGDNFMGGEDLTNNLIQIVLNKLNLEDPTPKQLNIIKLQCEKAKCKLSFKENTIMFFENITNDQDKILHYSRTQFYNDNSFFFNNIKNHIINTINDFDIDKIIFVGGTTKIPLIKTICQEIFTNDITICDNLNPDHIVSIGATLQGNLLTCQIQDEIFRETLILDVIPISLGVELENGIMSPIISKNTPLPITKTQTFTNSEDHMNSIQIDIYQGERKFVKDNILLSSFVLDNLDNTLKRGEMNIKVTFHVDKDGIITVTAQSDNESIKIHEINHFLSIPIKEDENDLVKIQDTKDVNLLLAKIELYNSYKHLLTVSNKHGNGNDKDIIQNLYNETLHIIDNYTNYSLEELRNCKIQFEKKWHEIMFL